MIRHFEEQSSRTFSEVLWSSATISRKHRSSRRHLCLRRQRNYNFAEPPRATAAAGMKLSAEKPPDWT
jgi:hypothetical protein